jgi:hypothetical protein
MKLTESRLRKIVKEEALKLQEENLYQLTADDIVKIVYSDEDRKVYSHIKNVASKLGLADNPLRGVLPRQLEEGNATADQNLTPRLLKRNFDNLDSTKTKSRRFETLSLMQGRGRWKLPDRSFQTCLTSTNKSMVMIGYTHSSLLTTLLRFMDFPPLNTFHKK